MIDTPQIITTQAQAIAFIPVQVARADIQKVMGPGLRELTVALKAQDIVATGAWFTYHLRAPGELFDFRICLPVDQIVAPAGRVQFVEIPATKVAYSRYHGGYEGLSSGWSKLMQWIEAQGYRAAPELWEIYLRGPETTADTKRWVTELNRPLLS